MKIIILMTTLLFSLNICAEKINVDFDERTETETNVFSSTNENQVVMGWFYANGNKQQLLNVNHNSDIDVGFKGYLKEIDIDADAYENMIFELPLNILTRVDSGYLYKSLLNNLYYPTYFN